MSAFSRTMLALLCSAVAWTAERPAPIALPSGELDADWLQMRNGEVLTGSVVVLRNGQLTFASSSYGTLTMPWSQVAQLKTKGAVVAVDRRRSRHEGPLVLSDGILRIGDDQPDREAILSLLPAGGSWWSLWQGSIALGLSMRDGNTDQLDYQARFEALRREALHRFTLSYLGNLSEVEGVETANNHRFNGRWDLFVAERLFLFPLAYEFSSDRFQNIDHRHTPSAGLGYTMVRGPRVTWEIGGGLGYQVTYYDSVQPGESDHDESAVLNLGTGLTTKVGGRGRLRLKYNSQIGLSGDAGVDHHLLATLAVDLVGSLDLTLSLLWDHVGDPKQAADGSTPERDDYTVTAGLAYGF